MRLIRKFIPILCVALGLGAASGQSDRPAPERTHGVGFCDVIQRSDSPCVLVNAAPETPESKSARSYLSLEKGLVVQLRTTEAIHSRDVHSHTFGDRVEFEVAKDVVIDGEVVIAAGSEAWGFLGQASQAPGRFLTRGYLQIMVEGTRAVTGEIVPLSGCLEVAGETPSDDDGTGGYAGLLLLGLFMKGNDAEVQRGTYISAQVTESLLLDRTAVAKMSLIPRTRAELQHATRIGRGLVIAYRMPADGCRMNEIVNGRPVRSIWCGKTDVAIDGSSPTALLTGRLLQFELDPGEHLLHGPHGEKLSVTVSSGSVQYVRVEVRSWKRRTRLAIVSSEIGEAESYPLEKTELASSVSIH